MKRTKSKAARGLVTRTIVYRDRKRPQGRNQELKVDVRLEEIMEEDYAIAMVAVRTGLSLTHVHIVRIV